MAVPAPRACRAASVDALANWLHQRLGRCDVLVSNGALLCDGDADAATVDLDAVAAEVATARSRELWLSRGDPGELGLFTPLRASP